MNEVKKEIEKATCAPVFSQRLAGFLMMRGFVLVALEPDKRHDRRNVFFFKDSELLHQAINQYRA